MTAEHDALRAETCIVCHGPVATPEQVAADGVDIPGVCYADCGGEHAETEEYARDWQRRALKAEEAIREVSDGADQTIRQFIEERDAALLSVSVAVQLRQVAERTRDAAQAVATRAEERARKAEQQAADAAALLIAAERQLAEWRGIALQGADFVHGRAGSTFIGAWADAVKEVAEAQGIDPAAGTGDHEREPGRNGE